MSLTRRSFIKGCTAVAVVGIPTLHSAQACQEHALDTATATRIEKSIKASFGGGFSLQAHRQSGQHIYANIEHRGNRYTVSTTDLFDWAILSAA